MTSDFIARLESYDWTPDQAAGYLNAHGLSWSCYVANYGEKKSYKLTDLRAYVSACGRTPQF